MLTDISDDDIEKVTQEIVDILATNKISILHTSTDSLIVRPSEIQAVLITKKELENTSPKKYGGVLSGVEDDISIS